MTYNGKQVYTPDTFNYSKVRVGDYVTEEVVDDAMDCLPPNGRAVQRPCGP